MEENATTQVIPATAASEADWAELGGVAMAVTVLAFIVPYIWLAIRRFEKLHKS